MVSVTTTSLRDAVQVVGAVHIDESAASQLWRSVVLCSVATGAVLTEQVADSSQKISFSWICLVCRCNRWHHAQCQQTTKRARQIEREREMHIEERIRQVLH